VLGILLVPSATTAPAAGSGRELKLAGTSSTNINLEPNPNESIGEFVDRLQARSNPAKIVAIGLFVQATNQAAAFAVRELRKGFVDAGETAPANLSRDVNLAVQAKWIARDPAGEDRWYVTNTGRDAAAAAFQGAKRRSPRRGKQIGANENDDSGNNGKPGRSTAGTSARLTALLDEGYFATARTTQEIIEALKERGLNVARTDLTQPLLTMVRAHPQRLKRSKTKRTGSTRAVWEYIAG